MLAWCGPSHLTMVWFCSKYPSFSYIQSTHHSQELCLKAIRFISFSPYPTKTQLNLKQCFDLVSETFVCFFLLCLPFSKQLKICWRKTSLPKPPRSYFWYCMCYFPAAVYGLAYWMLKKLHEYYFPSAWTSHSLEHPHPGIFLTASYLPLFGFSCLTRR